MNAKADWLSDAARAGVYQLRSDAREFAREAEAAGLSVHRADIAHAHGKLDFLDTVARAMRFPPHFGGNWDALDDCMKDLSWLGPARGRVLILEKSKHFSAAHPGEFKEAMDIMDEAAQYWRGEGKALWTLVSGPEGWQSGWPGMPETEAGN